MHTFADLQVALQEELKVDEHIITSDMDLPAINALWLRNSIWKKFQDELSPDADKRCLELFTASNSKCREFAFDPKSVFEEQVIGEVIRLFDDMFFNGPDFTFNLSDVLEGTDIGPGASIDSHSYNFYTKLFDGPLSCTSELLYREYRYTTARYPSWLSAEASRASRYGLSVVVGNRLSFVPKTSSISRSICTEPLLNMFFQKGLGSVLQQKLLDRYKINLSKQPELNRRLARFGSIDGSYATIDLSSASDSISLRLLEQILPRYVMRYLLLYRSPKVIFPDGNSEELWMVSSMGNAFTFPLQTLLFSTIVSACYRVLGIPALYTREGPKNFAVFGDDIIVRKDSYSFVVRCLELFGFSVNDQKSFNCGHFRESCGGDYYRGHDVRGVYIKSLKTRADVYSAINRIVRWSSRTGILLPKFVGMLRDSVAWLPVPYHAGDTEGIKVPYAPNNLRRKASTGGIIYKSLQEVPNQLKVPEDATKSWHYHSYGKLRAKASYNPDGLLISFCGGYIRNNKITLRSDAKRFRVVKKVTSNWGALPTDALFSYRVLTWCGYQSTLNGFSTRLSWLKSFSLGKSKFEVSPRGLRDDWEIVAALYFK